MRFQPSIVAGVLLLLLCLFALYFPRLVPFEVGNGCGVALVMFLLAIPLIVYGVVKQVF